jgi:hypothetical protein
MAACRETNRTTRLQSEVRQTHQSGQLNKQRSTCHIYTPTVRSKLSQQLPQSSGPEAVPGNEQTRLTFISAQALILYNVTAAVDNEEEQQEIKHPVSSSSVKIPSKEAMENMSIEHVKNQRKGVFHADKHNRSILHYVEVESDVSKRMEAASVMPSDQHTSEASLTLRSTRKRKLCDTRVVGGHGKFDNGRRVLSRSENWRLVKTSNRQLILEPIHPTEEKSESGNASQHDRKSQPRSSALPQIVVTQH